MDGLSKAAYNVLDVPFTKLGAKIEKRRRAEGVYPPTEIYMPSPEDSQDCFRNYTEDVARRQQLGQLKPGEDVKVDANGRVQVSGQVAVMKINGLLCKVIFDHNPTNEFYVEESFPLDWMYPYETPFGIIMKNQPPAGHHLVGRCFQKGPRVLEPILRAALRQLDHLRHHRPANRRLRGKSLSAQQF